MNMSQKFLCTGQIIAWTPTFLPFTRVQLNVEFSPLHRRILFPLIESAQQVILRRRKITNYSLKMLIFMEVLRDMVSSQELRISPGVLQKEKHQVL